MAYDKDRKPILHKQILEKFTTTTKSTDGDSIPIDHAFKKTLNDILGIDEISWGTVTGTLEALNFQGDGQVAYCLWSDDSYNRRTIRPEGVAYKTAGAEYFSTQAGAELYLAVMGNDLQYLIGG